MVPVCQVGNFSVTEQRLGRSSLTTETVGMVRKQEGMGLVGARFPVADGVPVSRKPFQSSEDSASPGKSDSVATPLQFALFLLVNAALFLRPGDLFSALESNPGIYEVLMVLALVFSLPRLTSQLNWRSLKSRPISVCVVGLLGAVFVSSLVNLGPGESFRSGYEFCKLVLYYLLLVGVVDTKEKIRWFIYYLGGLIFVLTTMALLQYHGVINNAALASYAERQWETADEETGEYGVVLLRLCAVGIYNNPNDLSRILVVGIMICLYGLGDQRLPLLRLFCLVLLGIFSYALALTHSRGGFLCLLTAVMVYLAVRFGGKKTVGLALIVVPLLFVSFGGRQTNLNMSGGTGHQRIEIWDDGFAEWRQNPLFGIGMDQHAEMFHIVAHNSFVHAYVELGFVGGTLFLGAFYLAVLLLYRVGKQGRGFLDGELYRFRPYLMGIIAGYMMGMMASSRNYIAPTYMLVGLGAAHVRLARISLPPVVTGLTNRLVGQVFLVSLLTVVVLYLYIKISLAHS
jgi:putative inorganic carbon (hco3(-)) transporter